MYFHIMTLFPEMVLGGLNESITGKAIEKGLIGVDAVNIRDFAGNRYGHVDDYTYGGGAGMLMQPGPVYDAYQHVLAQIAVRKEKKGTSAQAKKVRVLYMTPQGQPFKQCMAEEYAKEEDLVLLCGHYEGIDERVLEMIVTDYVSIGDFVLTGGELPAMMIVDATSRSLDLFDQVFCGDAALVLQHGESFKKFIVRCCHFSGSSCNLLSIYVSQTGLHRRTGSRWMRRSPQR